MNSRRKRDRVVRGLARSRAAFVALAGKLLGDGRDAGESASRMFDIALGVEGR